MYRFGPFDFDPAAGQLRRENRPVDLPPRAAFVLQCLLERAGELVSKDELLSVAWKDTAVSEHSLIEAIKVLRRALGDQRADRRYVQTVHRRGYRFIAPVASGSDSDAAPVAAGSRRALSGLRLGVLAVVVVVAALAAGRAWLRGDSRPVNDRMGRETQRFAVALHDEYPLWRGESIAISPDGRLLAYIGRGDDGVVLLLKETARLEWAPLVAVGVDGSFPVFSPDGAWIAFVAMSGPGVPAAIRRVAVSGGPAETVTEGGDPWGLTWESDGYIYFSDGVDLRRVTPGAVAEPFSTATAVSAPSDLLSDDPQYQSAQVLSDGRAVLLTRLDGQSPRSSHIVLRWAQTGREQVLLEGGSWGRYVEPGFLLYRTSEGLLARRIDLANGRLGDDHLEIFGADSYFGNAVSTTGTLLYYDPPEFRSQLVWVGPEGRSTPIDLDGGLDCRQPSISPDGGSFAVACRPRDARDRFARHIRVLQADGAGYSRLTEDGGHTSPVWAPDGTRLLYAVEHPDRWTIEAAVLGGSRETLLETGHPVYPRSVSPDGSVLAYVQIHPTTGADIWLLPLQPRGEPRPFLRTPEWESFPAFSPDGRWMAFHSGERPAGRSRAHIYVAGFPSGQPTRVSTTAGGWPLWSPSGDELLYLSGDLQGMMSVDARPGETFMHSEPRLLFATGGLYFPGLTSGGFALSPNERRFLVLDPPRVQNVPTLNVVLDLLDDLEKLPALPDG